MYRTADSSSHLRACTDVAVACVQMEPVFGSKASNVRRSVELIERAASGGASIVVLPELCNTGYVFESREEVLSMAEHVPDGETCAAWMAAASRLGIHLVAGIAERDGARLFNSAVVVGPAGYIGTYRKLHLWNEEKVHFEAGDLGLPVFDTELGCLGVAICYDGWFPEVYRLLAMKGADLVCMPTNWVPMPSQQRQRPAMANTLAMASAHSNGITILCANRVGFERGQDFIGQSVIVGADGWPLAGPASIAGEEIVSARINLSDIRRSRRLNRFNDLLGDRRSDVYDPMLGTGWPLPPPLIHRQPSNKERP